MANPHRGEVTLDTSERTYKLSFSVNALCELEDALGKSVREVVDELNATSDGPARISMKTLRVLIWAALIDHQPELTLTEAGKVTLNADVNSIMEKVGAALSIAFPPAEDAKAGTRPPKAKAG